MANTTLPIRKNIQIYRGRDFKSPIFRLKNPDNTPVDLTGYVIAGTLREGASQSAVLVADFTIGRNDTAGEFWFTLTDIQTVAINAALTIAYYDIKLTDTLASDKQYVQGVAQINNTVTI